MPVTALPNLDIWLKNQGEDAELLRFALTAFQGQDLQGQDLQGQELQGQALLGVAVSGGSDSLALLHLAAQIAPQLGAQVKAVTVDHRLRSGSADEAVQVAQICAGLGVAHDTLTWDHGTIAGNLMDRARRARYGLIADWALAQGVTRVAVAHTADDQAEAFVMGLARRAGLDGLSGMRAEWQQGVTFRRPLLAALRADLRAYLTRRGVAWIDDPSNDNPRFARARTRQVLQALVPLGITTDSLADVVQHLAAAQGALHQATVAAAAMVHETAGALRFESAAFAALPREIGRRLLAVCLRWINAADYDPRGPALDQLYAAVIAGRDATLAGCRLRINRDVHILREPHAVAGLNGPTDQPWDNRWHLDGPHAPDLTLRALGAEGLRALKDWRNCGIARDALLVSPAVWRDTILISAPLAGFCADWTATPRVAFAKFVLSH